MSGNVTNETGEVHPSGWLTESELVRLHERESLPPLPYREALPDEVSFNNWAPRFGDLPKIAPASTEDAAAFNRAQIIGGDPNWFRLCLRLQRTARKIPAVFPTALAASAAVPKTERVLDVEDWRRGMVGFSYDPRIEGTAGHIFFIVGRLDGVLLTASNDVKEPGVVDFVPVTFYTEHWGHKLQFAATNLNGFDFSDFNSSPKPMTNAKTLGEHYLDMVEELKKILARKKEKLGAKHPLVLALQADVNRMFNTYNAWKRVA